MKREALLFPPSVLIGREGYVCFPRGPVVWSRSHHRFHTVSSHPSIHGSKERWRSCSSMPSNVKGITILCQSLGQAGKRRPQKAYRSLLSRCWWRKQWKQANYLNTGILSGHVLWRAQGRNRGEHSGQSEFGFSSKSVRGKFCQEKCHSI